LANLPFREGTFDAVLASHVLYHLPEGEQASAVRELYRSLKNNGTCVIIYIWPSRARPSFIPARFRHSKGTPAPALYFHPHTKGWIRRTLPKHWKTDIRVWRSVGIGFTKALIADNLLGKVILQIIYWLEEAFPHALGRLGRYPIIVIQKTAG
jgi:SAM-dependent methyltransferase